MARIPWVKPHGYHHWSLRDQANVIAYGRPAACIRLPRLSSPALPPGRVGDSSSMRKLRRSSQSLFLVHFAR